MPLSRKADINVTPLIDVCLDRKIIAVMDSAKGAGVKRLGVVTPAMRRANNK